MNIIYMGTPEFAVSPLQALIDSGHNISLVVTKPDKVNARGNKINYSPVKKLAIEKNIEIYQPKNVSDEESYEYLKEKNPDIIIVCAFGQILKENILNFPKYGCINIHASLLPEYRGAAPIHRAIIEGREKSGITIMYMEKGLDTGDMLLKEEVIIDENMSCGQLHDKLSIVGGKLIVKGVEALLKGEITPKKQDDNKSTYANKIEKEDTHINFRDTSKNVHNLIRGLNPFPGGYALLDEKIIKIYKSKIINDKIYENPGCVVDFCKKDGLIVATKDGSVGIVELKPQGKKIMSAVDFYNGNKDIIGKNLK